MTVFSEHLFWWGNVTGHHTDRANTGQQPRLALRFIVLTPSPLFLIAGGSTNRKEVSIFREEWGDTEREADSALRSRKSSH